MSNINVLRDIESIENEIQSESNFCVDLATRHHPDQNVDLLGLMCRERDVFLNRKLSCIQNEETNLEKFKCLYEVEKDFQRLFELHRETLDGADLF